MTNFNPPALIIIPATLIFTGLVVHGLSTGRLKPGWRWVIYRSQNPLQYWAAMSFLIWVTIAAWISMIATIGRLANSN